MAWSFVQGIGTASWTTGKGTFASAATLTSSSETLAFASANTAGHLLLVAVATFIASGVTLSLSDTAGNTWSTSNKLTLLNTDGSTQIDLWWVLSCKAGANTITISAGTAKPYWEFVALEYGGGSSPTRETSGTTNEAATTTAHSVATAAAVTAADLLIGFYGDSVGGTTFSADTGTDRAGDNTQLDVDLQEVLSATAGVATLHTTTSVATQGNFAVVAFKTSSGTTHNVTLSATVTTSPTIARKVTYARTLSALCSTTPSILAGTVHHTTLAVTVATTPSIAAGAVRSVTLAATCSTNPSVATHKVVGAFGRPKDQWREEYSTEGDQAYSAYRDVFREIQADLPEDSWRKRLRDDKQRFF